MALPFDLPTIEEGRRRIAEARRLRLAREAEALQRAEDKRAQLRAKQTAKRQRMGLEFPSSHAPGLLVLYARDEAIAYALEQGMPRDEISARFRISKSRVRSVMAKRTQFLRLEAHALARLRAVLEVLSC